MSDFKVPYTVIRDIQPHGNADKLEVATVYGFQVVVRKGSYKPGDFVVYVPIDSVLPPKLEANLFPADSKIKLNNHRIRQIRIRGLASQGMLISPSDALAYLHQIRLDTQLTPEHDLAADLGITKYEPPIRGSSTQAGSPRNRNKAADHPLFHKYNGLNGIKWFPEFFREGEMIVIQEKLHGTNARAAYLPFVANTLWKKLQVRLGLAPKWEQHYGSNNVQISGKMQGPLAKLLQKVGFRKGLYTGYYGQDLYGTALNRANVFSRILPGEIIYGEIIGPGIQKGYEYGLSEHKFVLFDVKKLQEDGAFRWLTPREVSRYAETRGFETAPYIYVGPYNKEAAYKLTFGNSVYCPTQKVREGIVIKAAEGYDQEGNKRALKWVSEDYLADDTNTDNH